MSIGQITSHYQGDERVTTFSWSPNGRWIASGGLNDTIRIWDVETKTTIALWTSPSDTYDLAWSPDSRWLVSAHYQERVYVWDVAQRSIVYTYSKHERSVEGVSGSPDGQWIASASHDHTVHVWSPLTKETRVVYDKHDDAVFDVAWSPDGQLLASVGPSDRFAHLWEPLSGKGRAVLSVPKDEESGMECVCWSPDAHFLAMAGCSIRIWDITSQKLFRSIDQTQHPGLSEYIVWSPRGSVLAYVDCGTIHLWDVITDRHLFAFEGHHPFASPVVALSWSPDGTQIASVDGRGNVFLWEVA